MNAGASYGAQARHGAASASLRWVPAAGGIAAPLGVVTELAQELGALHERGALPDIDELRTRFAPRQTSMPEVRVVLPSAADYDELLEAA
ncbi:hypothetical protein PY257_12170 [Ramlibacter sp. H39-3-26]|uniref:hypothetical protein n=1 Tax=Curvibacter soli TaxID=3031331 RepID=UPI0023DC1CD0|nr:hypothetical protein [Ramlibacter sp. H39-3-26]MDF1485927.1 hypothetical protein [Ramlibacter sp. H39-3-26]